MSAIDSVIDYAQSSDGFTSIGNEAFSDFEHIRETVKAMSEYRQRNTLNFQIEKLDDFIRELENALF